MINITYKLFFKAFYNKSRFEIVNLLMGGPRNVGEISKKLNFEQSRVSHNLKCLESCGFVNSKRKGKEKIYSLDKKHIMPILKMMDKHIESYNVRLKKCGILHGKNNCGVL